MTDVADFAGALDTAAAVTIARLAPVGIVVGQRLARGSDIGARRWVVARRTDHGADRDRPLDNDDDDDGGGQ